MIDQDDDSQQGFGGDGGGAAWVRKAALRVVAALGLKLQDLEPGEAQVPASAEPEPQGD